MKSGIPNNVRWKIFADFLEVHGNDYAQVLATDTRDVIFQGDVFEPFKKYSSYLGYSTEADDIGGSKTGDTIDRFWLIDCFGKEETEKLLDKTIICDGTVIGTATEMKIFSQKMWELLSDIDKRVNYRIHDQPIANYLIHNKLLPIRNIIEIDPEHGVIFTDALVKHNKTRGDFILRGDDGVPAVVHQYDRHAPLVQLVDRVYRDKNFQADERFTDPRSILEQVKQLLYIGKLDEAAEFFMNNHGADFGGEIDLLLKIWEMLFSRPLFPAVGYLELSIQNALASPKNFPQKNLDKICSLLIFSIKNRRTVNPQLVQFIAGGLFNLAGQFIDTRAAAPCFFCLDAIKALELPPNKDFYLLQAKAFRTFGRKDEALAAYKQALEFD